MKVNEVIFEACSCAEFRVVNAYPTFTLTCLIILLGILISTFLSHLPTCRLVTFQLDIFISIPNRYLHISPSFPTTRCITVDKFYAFSTSLIDGLIFASRNCDIFLSINESALHNFHNCIIDVHSLLALFLTFLFTKINVKFIWPETPLRNWLFLTGLIFGNWEGSEFVIFLWLINFLLSQLIEVSLMSCMNERRAAILHCWSNKRIQLMDHWFLHDSFLNF